MTVDHERGTMLQRFSEFEFMMFRNTFPQIFAGCFHFDFQAEGTSVIRLIVNNIFFALGIDKVPDKMQT